MLRLRQFFESLETQGAHIVVLCGMFVAVTFLPIPAKEKTLDMILGGILLLLNVRK